VIDRWFVDAIVWDKKSGQVGISHFLENGCYAFMVMMVVNWCSKLIFCAGIL